MLAESRSTSPLRRHDASRRYYLLTPLTRDLNVYATDCIDWRNATALCLTEVLTGSIRAGIHWRLPLRRANRPFLLRQAPTGRRHRDGEK